MAAQVGEDIIATLFADVHYYFSDPYERPPHHRFEKTSYVYLFENVEHHCSRLEIVNNAGTEYQDAFNGLLTDVELDYSYDHPCLVTLTTPSDSLQVHLDTTQWHLPSFDEYNNNRYLFRIHTVDLYFYQQADALLFVDAIRRVLPEHQARVRGAPIRQALYTSSANNLAQSLENVDDTDPAFYRTASSAVCIDQERSVVKPKTYHVCTTVHSSCAAPSTPLISPPLQTPIHTQPLSYNPAAPAEPEPILHREKTPPPPPLEEDIPSTPHNSLFQAQITSPSQNLSPFESPTYFPGPPQMVTKPRNLQPPPPPPATFPASTASHFAFSNAALIPSTSSLDFRSGLQSPPLQPPNFATSLAHAISHSSHTHTESTQPQCFSPHEYIKPLPEVKNDGHGIHKQVYIPTMDEARSGGGSGRGEVRGKGKLEQRADRIEKGVGGFLKRMERKYL